MCKILGVSISEPPSWTEVPWLPLDPQRNLRANEGEGRKWGQTTVTPRYPQTVYLALILTFC